MGLQEGGWKGRKDAREKGEPCNQDGACGRGNEARKENENTVTSQN